jgi:RiboL-PSP-HEPN
MRLMPKNRVDELFASTTGAAAALKEQGEISYYTAVEDIGRKVLLLAAASYFEAYLTEMVVSYLSSQLKEGHPLYKIVKSKGIDRQYHTWFDWDKKQATKFFSLFGDGFRAFVDTKIGQDQSLRKSIEAFLELGLQRNLLVHENFGVFTLEKTFEELYGLYKEAKPFVYSIQGWLAEYTATL